MKRFALVLSFFLVPSIIFGYISPGKPSGFVNDFAGILSSGTISQLNIKLENFSQTTGNEISVVTIKNLGDETIETYAEKLFQEWGIGRENEDNGLLLLISLEDKATRIEVGYGLEPTVTDIDSGRIVREILTPAFQAGDYDGGVSQAVDTVVNIVGGEQTLPSQNSGSVRWLRYFPYTIFALIYLASILGRSKSWWAGGIIGGILGIIFLHTIVFVGLSILVGLLFDFIVSRVYKKTTAGGGVPPWWIGGSGISGGGGGFGGFGGGMSGGGGASGRW